MINTKINYYSHLLLNSKYKNFVNLIIVLFIFFILIGLNINIAECTLEHPTSKGQTAPISIFAPAKTMTASQSLALGSKPGPKFILENIRHVNDLKPFINIDIGDWSSQVNQITKRELQIYDNSTLINWVKPLHTVIPNKLTGLVHKNGSLSYDIYSHFQFYGCIYDESVDPGFGNTFSKHQNYFVNNFSVAPNVAHNSRDTIISILRERGFNVKITNIIEVTK